MSHLHAPDHHLPELLATESRLPLLDKFRFGSLIDRAFRLIHDGCAPVVYASYS